MNNKDLEFAKSFPILFSQVREDPRLDLNVIFSIPNNNINVLMIGSGGCTLGSLAYHAFKIGSIDVVDANLAQLDLCRLKLALASHSPQNRAAILGHLPMQDRKSHLLTLFKQLNISLNIFGDFDIVSEYGPDYVGRYEWLFRAFSSDFQKTQLGIQLPKISSFEEQQAVINQDVSEITSLFNEHFSLDTLVGLFGKEAVQNRAKPYSLHFYNRFIWSLQHQFIHQNPFFYQFAYLAYPKLAQTDFLSLPPFRPKHITLHHCTMFDHLVSCASNSYDFIHLSNILDWLDAESRQKVLKETSRVLKPCGKVLIRQLNSTMTIENTSQISFKTIPEADLIKNDLSFFYPKTYIGVKHG